MLFNSLTYLLFLGVVVVIYWQLPNQGRLWLIFFASCLFYGFWRVEFVPLLLFSAFMDYFLARWIDRTQDERRRFQLLVISVCANLAILILFKYLIFFVDTFGALATLVGYRPSFVDLKIILPLGISFYIFATISYVIDVYRREFPAEKNVLVYINFVLFFPHLVAGPILRAQSLIPQLRDRPAFDLSLVGVGLTRIIAGLLLKVYLADPIASLVDEGFMRDPASLSGLDSLTLSFLFGFQIYFDFAGYSHIAIGSSLLLGVVLPENFNFPYSATSPREFWRRWHISLSTWIRDYVYLPMAGSYRRQDNVAIADHASAPQSDIPRDQRTLPLFATWALMGLWHGANWTFVVWGLYHALAVYLHRQIARIADRFGWVIPALVGWVATLPVMMAGWIAFRAPTLHHTLVMWQSIVDPRKLIGLSLLPTAYLTAAATLFAVMFCSVGYARVLPMLDRDGWKFQAVAFVAHSFAIAAVFVFLRVTAQFIYFQF